MLSFGQETLSIGLDSQSISHTRNLTNVNNYIHTSCEVQGKVAPGCIKGCFTGQGEQDLSGDYSEVRLNNSSLARPLETRMRRSIS